MFDTSPVFQAAFNSNEKIVIMQGGTSSGKTYAIIQLLYYRAVYNPKTIITVTGESIPNLKKGAYRDAETILSRSPYLQSQIESWNKSDRIIYFKNGSLIEFVSNLTEQSAKNGKRDYLFCNEAQGISWSIFFQLAIRTRKQIFLDYNPTAPFWAHDKLVGTLPATNELSATVKLFISDHRHNPFLSEEEHAKIEGIKDPQLHRVYARGFTGNLLGLIFPDWQIIPDEQFPKDAPFFGGLDFGYTNDPTAGVKIARVGESIFIHELCYTPGIAPMQMKQIFLANGFNDNIPIYCEHDPDNVGQLRRLGIMALPARKGAGSINAGIIKLKEYKVFYTASSTNLDFERKRYVWKVDPVSGKSTNEPIDMYNHCFSGDTCITTSNGLQRIDSILPGDYVLTSKGYKKVLKRFNNGLKQTTKYKIQLDTICVYLRSTSDHKIKTTQSWEPISKLKSGQQVYLHRCSTERNIDFIQKKNIFQEVASACMLLFGNSQMAKFLKGITSTTKTLSVGTTISPILNWLKSTNIFPNTQKKDLKTIPNGLKSFREKELQPHQHGINRKKVDSGILHMEKNVIKQESISKRFANNAEINTQQGIRGLQNSVITTAKLKHLEQGESRREPVYDLMIEGEHEYFANGILVHNCMDGTRYGVYTHYFTE